MDKLKIEAELFLIDTPRGPRQCLKDEKRLTQYVADGLRDEDIADLFGCMVATVRRSRLHYRILRPTGKPAKILDADALEGLLRQGLTTQDIAERFGCSTRCVVRAKARYGFSNRQPENGRRFTDQDRERLTWMLEDGWPITEIAATTGWEGGTIRRHAPAGASWTAFEAGKFAGALTRIRRSAARHDWLPPTLSGNIPPAPIRPYRAQAA